MKKIAVLMSAILLWAAVVLQPLRADQTDPQLDELFAELRETPGPLMQARIEQAIWRVWIDSGSEQIDRLMNDGVEAMGRHDFDAALELFDQIVERRPDFAEGWNKRATVYYLRDELAASMRDVQRTLELEPRHFGALSGMGLIFMQRGDVEAAIRSFQEVLKVNPHAAGAKANIEMLKARQRERLI